MILMSIKLNPNATATPLLLGLTYMRVKQRLIYVYTYKKYDSKADIETLENFTKQWTGRILAAN